MARGIPLPAIVPDPVPQGDTEHHPEVEGMKNFDPIVANIPGGEGIMTGSSMWLGMRDTVPSELGELQWLGVSRLGSNPCVVAIHCVYQGWIRWICSLGCGVACG